MRDDLQNKRVRRGARENARRGRRALREKSDFKGSGFVRTTVLPDSRILNDFLGKTKRTVAPCVLEQKEKRTTVQRLNRSGCKVAGDRLGGGKAKAGPFPEVRNLRSLPHPAKPWAGGMTKNGALCGGLDVLIRRHPDRAVTVLWVEGADEGPEQRYGWRVVMAGHLGGKSRRDWNSGTTAKEVRTEAIGSPSC